MGAGQGGILPEEPVEGRLGLFPVPHAAREALVENELGVALGVKNPDVRSLFLGFGKDPEKLPDPGQSRLPRLLSPWKIPENPGPFEKRGGAVSGGAGRRKKGGIPERTGTERGGTETGGRSEKKGKKEESGSQSDCRFSTFSLFR